MITIDDYFGIAMENLPIVFAAAIGCFLVAKILRHTVKIVPSGSQSIREKWGKFDKIAGPGVHVLMPLRDSLKRVSWSRREEDRSNTTNTVARKTYNITEIPTQQQLHDLPDFEFRTKERAIVFANGMIFYTIIDVKKAVYGVADLYTALESIIESSLAEFFCRVGVDEVFDKRDEMMAHVLKSLSSSESDWGVVINRFDLQEIRFTPEYSSLVDKSLREKKQMSIKEEMEKKSAHLRHEALKRDTQFTLEKCQNQQKQDSILHETQKLKAMQTLERETLAIESETKKALQIQHKEAQLLEVQRQENIKQCEQECRIKEIHAKSNASQKAIDAEACLNIYKERSQQKHSLKAKRIEAEAKAILSTAKAKAEAIKVQGEAEAETVGMKHERELVLMEGLSKLNGFDVGEYMKTREQTKAWGSMAANPNNKIVLPYDQLPLLGAQALMKHFGLGDSPQ